MMASLAKLIWFRPAWILSGIVLSLLLLIRTVQATPPAPGDPMRWPGATPWKDPVPTTLTVLTLHETIDKIFDASLTIEAAELAVRAAKHAINIQRSQYWPTLSLSGSWEKEYSESEGHSPAAYAAGIDASWLLFDGFQQQFSMLKVKHETNAARFAEEEARRLLMRSVSSLWFNGLLAQDRMNAARGDIKFNDMMLTQMQKRYVTGTASRSEVLNFKIRITEDVDTYLTQQQLFAINLAALQAMMDTDSPLSVNTHRIENPYQHLGSGIDSMTVDLDQELNYAKEHRADLLQLKENIAVAEADLNLSLGSYLPEIELSADYSLNREEDLQFDLAEDSSVSAGVTFSWEIFKGGESYYKMKAAQDQLAIAKTNYGDRLRQLSYELKQYSQNLEYARMRVSNNVLARNAAKEDRKLVTNLYTSGLVAITRLNEVQKDLMHSNERLIKSRILFYRTWEELQIAAGHLRPEAFSATTPPARIIDDAVSFKVSVPTRINLQKTSADK